MVGRGLRSREKGKARALNRPEVPDVYQEMLAEALPAQSNVPERPLKKRKTGRRGVSAASDNSIKQLQTNDDVNDDDDGDDVQFEDVPGLDDIEASNNESEVPLKRIQTTYRESDEDSGNSDVDWEQYELDARPQESEPSGDLELTLSVNATPQRPKSIPRRRNINKAERGLRLEVHRMHVLCLLSHIDRRNTWCNDPEVQESLRPLVDKKMLQYLTPSHTLSQFGRTESLKRGLDQVAVMWRKKFNIISRGIRRALWADDEGSLQNHKLPEDMDSSFEKLDFRAAAKSLRGSRDLGAQLYCALLRSADVNARLVCSLQPLSFNAGGPSMSVSSSRPELPSTPDASDEEEAVDINSATSPLGVDGPSSLGPSRHPRRRLGHPNAADYSMPEMRGPAPRPPKPKRRTISESPYPVFWVEVFDESHQKWFPVDPLVTQTIAKPRSFEPPAADRENNMSYVIAFEDEGCARDITRRYTKAYNAKTRKTRVESTDGGAKWWRKTLRAYFRGYTSDVDQIEDTELATAEAREPMPKNVADFKDHPVYALERHLRRNEVLANKHEIGKVAAGRDASVPGGKKLESIYRRRDVKVAKSADAWYRLGREVKLGEQPLKTVTPKSKTGGDDPDRDVDIEERPGTNLYSEDQTDIYVPPPIVNGLVPKNSFGNLDIYVPSMVPRGGVHILHDEAGRAARLLGIDYTDALTGFEFRGRHGTAVLKGIIVAVEYRDAVNAVVEGFSDARAEAEEKMRSVAALKMWRQFLMSLRIKQRVDTYEIEGEEPDYVPREEGDNGSDEGMKSEEYFSDGAGGFFPE